MASLEHLTVDAIEAHCKVMKGFENSLARYVFVESTRFWHSISLSVAAGETAALASAVVAIPVVVAWIELAVVHDYKTSSQVDPYSSLAANVPLELAVEWANSLRPVGPRPDFPK